MRTGYYSKALASWKEAWQLARFATDRRGKALADRVGGELACMLARIGRMEELERLLKSVETHVFAGSATERITGAREGLWSMQNQPETSFRCGPLALHRVLLAANPHHALVNQIHAAVSTKDGFSLVDVAELSRQLGLNFQMAFRETDGDFIVPSVVHWKLDHYAAMVRREQDRYLIEDPTFGNNVWMSREALEAETSGYFLVPPGKLSSGWRAVEREIGETVKGKGTVGSSDPNPLAPCDPHTPGASCDGPCWRSSRNVFF